MDPSDSGAQAPVNNHDHDPPHPFTAAPPHESLQRQPPNHFLDCVVNPPSHSNSRRHTPLFDHYFDDAFHSSPSPPTTSFFDNILNPAAPNTYPASLRRLPFPQREQGLDLQYSPTFHPSPMPPARPPRLANGYVDLTAEPDTPAEPRRRQKRSPTPGPSGKRQKRDDGAAVAVRETQTQTPEANIDEIDLSDEKAGIQHVLQKQREEAVKAQKKPEEKNTTFNTLTCVICMDVPTDITATSCGHLFCHTCLMEALIAGENRSGPNEPKRSQCPVCRKFINRTKASDIIPLLLKKGLATQPRKSSTTGAKVS